LDRADEGGFGGMKKTVDMGVKTSVNRGLVRMIQVKPGSSAWDAGVSVGDEWIAVSGIRVTRKNRLTILNWFEPGDTVELLLNRNGRVMELRVNLAADPGELGLVTNSEASDLEREIFQSIFLSDGSVKEMFDGTNPSQ